MKSYRSETIVLVMLMLPALLLIGVFVVIPVLWATYIGFTNQSLLGPRATELEFIGLDNYFRLFTDKSFWASVQVTLIFVFVSSVLGQSLLGLGLALLFKSTAKSFMKALLGGAAILAWILPEIVTVYIWASALNYDSGSANQLLAFFGIEHQRWLIDLPLLSLIVVNIWRGAAFSMLVFSSGLETVPVSLYEASAVDGAGIWDQFVFVTLPMIRSTILINLVLVTISGFAAFGIIYALTGGGPLGQTELISVYVFRNAFSHRDLGYGSAASVLMFAGNLLLGAFYFYFLRAKSGRMGS